MSDGGGGGGGSCAKEIAADASSDARKVKRKELSIGSKRIILSKYYQAPLLFQWIKSTFFVFLIGGTCEARSTGMAVRATSSEPSKE